MSSFPPDHKPTPTSDVAPSQCMSRLLSVEELDQARDLFVRDPEWGTFYGDKFRVETEQNMKAPPSAAIGVFLPDGKLVGVGVALKEHFDYAYWSLTWIFVDIDARGAGFGRSIVDALLHHVRSQQAQSHNPNVRVMLATSEDVERFYQQGWGFKTLAHGPLPGERLMILDLVGPGLALQTA